MHHRFGFLALRVGIVSLLRRMGSALLALVVWLLTQLDYARDYRSVPAAPNAPALASM